MGLTLLLMRYVLRPQQWHLWRRSTKVLLNLKRYYIFSLLVFHSGQKLNYYYFLKISKEKAAQIVERLCPSNIGQVSNKPKYVSMAEENKKFFGTPDRFRKKPRSSSADTGLRGLLRTGLRKRSPSPSVPVNKAITALSTLTMPHSPQLLTRGRTRCNHQTGEPEKSEVKYVYISHWHSGRENLKKSRQKNSWNQINPFFFMKLHFW